MLQRHDLSVDSYDGNTAWAIGVWMEPKRLEGHELPAWLSLWKEAAIRNTKALEILMAIFKMDTRE